MSVQVQGKSERRAIRADNSRLNLLRDTSVAHVYFQNMA